MPKRKATASKAVKKSSAKKKVGKKVAKAPSYLQQIDKIYQEVKAKIKSGIAAAEKQGKQLKAQQNKLNKAEKANQKALLTLEKKNKGKTTATAKSQMNKALKAQKATAALLAEKQKATAAALAIAQDLKQQLTLITDEERNVAEFRKTAKPAAAVTTKIKKEKVAKAPKAKKSRKASPSVSDADLAQNKNQFALVMEDDFMTENDEAAMDKEHI